MKAWRSSLVGGGGGGGDAGVGDGAASLGGGGGFVRMLSRAGRYMLACHAATRSANGIAAACVAVGGVGGIAVSMLVSLSWPVSGCGGDSIMLSRATVRSVSGCPVTGSLVFHGSIGPALTLRLPFSGIGNCSICDPGCRVWAGCCAGVWELSFTGFVGSLGCVRAENATVGQCP